MPDLSESACALPHATNDLPLNSSVVLPVLQTPKLTKAQRLLLRFFGEHPEWEQGTRPLAALLDLSRPTIQTAIMRLADLGLLQVDPGTNTRPNGYRVTAPLVPLVGGQIFGQVAKNLAREGVKIWPGGGQISKPSEAAESTLCDGPSRAFHYTTLTNTIQEVKCSAADPPPENLSGEVVEAVEHATGIRFRPGDPLQAACNSLAETYGLVETLRAVERKGIEKRRYQIKSLGAFVGWVREDLERRRVLPRKPIASVIEPPEWTSQDEQNWIREFGKPRSAYFAAAGGSR